MMRPKQHLLTTIAIGAICWLLGLCLSSTAHAEPADRDLLLLSGVEIAADDGYAYMGLLRPFEGSQLGNGWVQRYWVDYLWYSYEEDHETVRASAPGAEVAIGYAQSDARGSYEVSLGLNYRDTSLSPDSRESDVRGGQWGLRPQLSGERILNADWRVNGTGSFNWGKSAYWMRARLLRRLRGDLWLGPEAVVHGNPDYSANQLSAVLLGVEPAQNISLGLRVGVKTIHGEHTSAYSGIEMSWLL